MPKARNGAFRRSPADWGRAWLAALHRLLSAVLHRQGRVCVYGWPDHEENSLFAAVLLSRMPDLQVTLLARRPQLARRYLSLIAADHERIRVVAKNSLAGLLHASAAEVLLFTHGLYGSPDLTRRKLVINLWHGYGPKANDNPAFSARIPFSVLTCNTPVWGAAAARWLGAGDARVLRSGNPRQVAFSLPSRPAALRRLGLERDRFVLWMPTYREANGASGPRWRDSPDLSARLDARGTDPVSEIAVLAKAAGVTLVVKPHPLDSARFDRSGLRVVTTDEILGSGMTLYQFIAASAAMVSDYSSVWVEYLDLDKPLALYCPDLGDYTAGRGFSEPTMMELTPGLIVEEARELGGFLAAAASGGDWRPEQRRRARENLKTQAGLVRAEAFTSAVMRELERHRTLRNRPAPPSPRPEVAFHLSNDHSRSPRVT
ncbi:CDP-glycerol glycerophosphotransferase family protein [Phenylobacterium sp.]|uniref:CDP-glycerol glycerophosphotransferase family protein n=1 Tax=Phenylobacterium sp. TaxID=1871053 RepID=UPI0035B0A254